MSMYIDSTEAVHRMIGDTAPHEVRYSAGTAWGDSQLDQVIAEGEVVFVSSGNDFFGTGGGYRSPVVSNPTYMDAAIAANEAIIETADYHHVFFEDVVFAGEVDGIKIFQLSMGS